MNNHTTGEGSNVARLADALVRWAGSGTLIIDHMTRNRGGPDPIPDVLRELIRSVLEQLRGRHPDQDLTTAVGVLDDALETLGEELFLVETAGPEAPF